jgi:stearoyl-CoA desaturase (delta-9 desaturase)
LIPLAERRQGTAAVAGSAPPRESRSDSSPTAVVPEAPAAPPPWTWRWTRWQPGEGWTFFWICLIHVLAVVGFVLFPLPGWGLFAAAYGIMWLGGLGTTVGYHRAIAHRAVKLNPVVEFLLIGAAIFNGSGSPATWTANHRLHHARSDGPEDISSPRVGGFWWAHLRWLWQTPQSPITRWAPDLNTSYYRFWTRFQGPILVATLFIGLPFGWKAFFWLGAIRLVAALHAQCVANSISHLKRGARIGEDSSQNVPWLAPVQGLQGENWHKNHHGSPSLARLGWTWKQVDLGWWFIVLLEKLRLATDVRRARPVVVRVEPPGGQT